MPFAFHFKYEKTLNIKKEAKAVFSFIKDYPAAIPDFFPAICRFEEQNPGVYFWEFEPMSYGGKTFTISLCTQFEEGVNQINILPLPKTGNAVLRGRWAIEPQLTGCCLNFFFDLEFEVPLPLLTKSLILPIANKELLKLFDRYTTNVQNHFK